MNCAAIILGAMFIVAAIGLGAILVYAVWTTERKRYRDYRRYK